MPTVAAPTRKAAAVLNTAKARFNVAYADATDAVNTAAVAIRHAARHGSVIAHMDAHAAAATANDAAQKAMDAGRRYIDAASGVPYGNDAFGPATHAVWQAAQMVTDTQAVRDAAYQALHNAELAEHRRRAG